MPHSVAQKDEPHNTFGLPINVTGLAEIRVTSQSDLSKPGPPAKIDGLIEAFRRSLRRGAIAAPIDQEERLLRIRQGYDPRVISPDSVVRDVHPFLALARSRSQCPVGVNNSLFEKRIRLLLPHPQAGFVDNIHQRFDVDFVEATTEISCSRRIGNSLSTERVKVNLVVASDFYVFEACAAGHDVIGDVEDMVGLVVRKVSLEEFELAIDRPLYTSPSPRDATLSRMPSSA